MASVNPPQIKIADFGLAKASGLNGLLAVSGFQRFSEMQDSIISLIFCCSRSRVPRYTSLQNFLFGVVVVATITGSIAGVWVSLYQPCKYAKTMCFFIPPNYVSSRHFRLTGTLPIPSEIDMPVQYNQIGVWNLRREQSLNNLKAKEYQPEGNGK